MHAAGYTNILHAYSLHQLLSVLQSLNEEFDVSLCTLLCRPQRPHVDEATLISIDKLGADVRVRVGSDYSVERMGWQNVRHMRIIGCLLCSNTTPGQQDIILLY